MTLSQNKDSYPGDLTEEAFGVKGYTMFVSGDPSVDIVRYKDVLWLSFIVYGNIQIIVEAEKFAPWAVAIDNGLPYAEVEVPCFIRLLYGKCPKLVFEITVLTFEKKQPYTYIKIPCYLGVGFDSIILQKLVETIGKMK